MKAHKWATLLIEENKKLLSTSNSTHTQKQKELYKNNCVPIFFEVVYNGMICTWSCCKLAIQTCNTCSLDKQFSPRGANFRQCSTIILLTAQSVLLIIFSSRLKYRLERKCSLIKNWYCLQEKIVYFCIRIYKYMFKLDLPPPPIPATKWGWS